MDRSLPRGSFQLKAVLTTFLVSAFFHGFYIGYYLFFIGLFLLDLACKFFGNTAIYATIEKRLPEKVFRTLCVALIQLELRYLTIVFSVLTWKNCSNFLQAYYACGHLLPILVIVVSLVIPKARKERKSIAGENDQLVSASS